MKKKEEWITCLSDYTIMSCQLGLHEFRIVNELDFPEPVGVAVDGFKMGTSCTWSPHPSQEALQVLMFVEDSQGINAEIHSVGSFSANVDCLDVIDNWLASFVAKGGLSRINHFVFVFNQPQKVACFWFNRLTCKVKNKIWGRWTSLDEFIEEDVLLLALVVLAV